MADWQQIVDMAAGIQADTTNILSATTEQTDLLGNINNNLIKLLQQPGGVSQSNARDYSRDYRSNSGDHFRREYSSRYGYNGRGSASREGFLDSFEQAILEGFLGENFKDELKDVAKDFADQFGVSIQDLPGTLGKQLGKTAMDAFKSSEIGKVFTGQVSKLKDRALSSMKNKGSSFADWIKDPATAAKGAEKINDFVNQFRGAGGGLGGVKNVAQTILKSTASGASSLFSTITGAAGSAFSGAASTAAAGLAEVGAVAAAAGAAFPPLGVAIAGTVIAVKAFKTILGSAGLAIKSIKTMFDALKVAGDRDAKSRKDNLEWAKRRMKEDYETMVREPYEILKKAASDMYSVWNNNLRTINATQGYTKSDLQDLMASYASRLRSEGLDKYISGATITENLAKVLNSGMSGAIAEEFSYLATKLQASVPTQDFFNYASTYASIAANAVRSGKSQEEAIAIANKSLTDFASGLLYANRELTGGFTTGLTNAASLYEQSAKIALAARSENLSQINAVMLATQGYVGAVAPDLASSITGTIYKALTGGNSADIVALRSLAGINASNTEFLQAVAKNPQKVFSTLFENLARMYNDSSAAYMEKAEGYAQLFGLTSEAFQRIDFSGLAQSIARMNMSDASLNENMKLLVDGQTTTTAEQLKAQQINKYMVEEGLAYVIDNEAAQMIQEHMWNEQIARELQEAQYAVELKGSAAEALEMLKQSVNNILNFLNPFSWLKKAGNVVATAIEGAAQQADVRQMLELGKVGQGNAKDLYNLTTRNANLGLTPKLVALMGGYSAYGAAQTGTRAWNALSNGMLTIMDGARNLDSFLHAVATNSAGSAAQGKWSNGVSSKYSWGSITKSGARAAAAILGTRVALPSPVGAITTASGSSAASGSAATVKASIDRMLEDSYINQFIEDHKSYEDWAASASKFRISDFSRAIQDAGYTETQLRGYFQDKEAEKGFQEVMEEKNQERIFRETGIAFWTKTFPEDYKNPLFEMLETNNQRLQDIIDNQVDWVSIFRKEWLDVGWSAFVSESAGGSGLFNKFYSDFMKYIVNHWSYTHTAGYTYSDVEDIRKKADAQERGDTVYALAEMLTKNIVDLKDPTIQTNALLAQILIVVNAIMNQQNEVAGTTGQNQLLESLSAMALGMTTSNPLASTSEPLPV